MGLRLAGTSHRQNPCRKLFAVFLAACLLQNFVTAPLLLANQARSVNHWIEAAAPSAPSVAMPGLRPLRSADLNAREDLSGIAGDLPRLPLEFSNLRRALVPPGWKAGQPVVIHIQDIHLNEDAQKNISASVHQLINEGGVDFVALEGAFGPLDLEKFRSSGKLESTVTVADFLLKKNKITGPVHAGLTARRAPIFTGVDDRQRYAANVSAYLGSFAAAPARLRQLKRVQLQLERRKLETFNPRLLAFDRVVQSHRGEKIPLGQYVRALAAVTPLAEDSDEVRKFLVVLNMESSIDFRAVEKQRGDFLGQLARSIGRRESENLANAAIAYRCGKLDHSEFYGRLESIGKKHGVRFSEFPELVRYVRYAALSDGIRSDKFFDQLGALEASAYRVLVRSEDEKRLLEQSRAAGLTGRLLDYSLSPGEWRAYQSLAGKDPELAMFEEFFREATLRDRAMSFKLLREMKERGSNVAVLVAGGFHSSAIEKDISASGVAVLTLSPKVEKIETFGGAQYLSIFAREKTPIEKLFSGEKLFVSIEPWTLEAQRSAAIDRLALEEIANGADTHLDAREVDAGMSMALGEAANGFTARLQDAGPGRVRVSVSGPNGSMKYSVSKDPDTGQMNVDEAGAGFTGVSRILSLFVDARMAIFSSRVAAANSMAYLAAQVAGVRNRAHLAAIGAAGTFAEIILGAWLLPGWLEPPVFLAVISLYAAMHVPYFIALAPRRVRGSPWSRLQWGSSALFLMYAVHPLPAIAAHIAFDAFVFVSQFRSSGTISDQVRPSVNEFQSSESAIHELYDILKKDLGWKESIQYRDISAKRRRILETLLPRSPPSAANHDLEQIVGRGYVSSAYLAGDVAGMEKESEDRIVGRKLIERDLSLWLDQKISNGLMRRKDKDRALSTLTARGLELLELAWKIPMDDGSSLESGLTTWQRGLLTMQIIEIIATGKIQDPDFDPYRERNDLSNATALAMLRRFEPGLSVRQLLLRSARVFEILKYEMYDGRESGTADAIAVANMEKLASFDSTVPAIDAYSHFENSVLNAKTPVTVAWLPDDNGESVLVLKLAMEMLLESPNLSINFIPKRANYRTDLSYLSTLEILEDPIFEPLRGLQEKGRFNLIGNGPPHEGTDMSRLSGEAFAAVNGADYLFSVGALQFEMLRNVQKPAFHLFEAYGNFSMAVSGVPKGGVVFAYVPQGSDYFTASWQDRRIMRSAGGSFPVVDRTAAEFLYSVPENKLRDDVRRAVQEGQVERAKKMRERFGEGDFAGSRTAGQEIQSQMERNLAFGSALDMRDKLLSLRYVSRLFAKALSGGSWTQGTSGRSVQILVMDSSRRKVLLQQRGAFKRSFPYKWTVSANGKPKDGETLEAAAARAVQEEVGITPDLRRLETVGSAGSFRTGMISYDFFAFSELEEEMLREILRDFSSRFRGEKIFADYNSFTRCLSLYSVNPQRTRSPVQSAAEEVRARTGIPYVFPMDSNDESTLMVYVLNAAEENEISRIITRKQGARKRAIDNLGVSGQAPDYDGADSDLMRFENWDKVRARFLRGPRDFAQDLVAPYFGNDDIWSQVTDILPAAHPMSGRLHLVGGKGLNLHRLRDISKVYRNRDGLHFKVPETEVLTTAAFERYVLADPEVSRLVEKLESESSENGIEETASALRTRITRMEMPVGLRKGLSDVFRKLGRDVAARSSANVEDIEGSSAAGLAQSFLHIITEEELFSDIKKVWASLYSKEFVTHRKTLGFSEKEARMAVVLQQFVDPKAAGVLFTVHDETQWPLHVIEAQPGLGEGVVQQNSYGSDRWITGYMGDVIFDKSIVPKRARIAAGRGGGVREESIIGDDPSLSDVEVLRLSLLSGNLQRHYLNKDWAEQLDIEFCFGENGELYILQARPKAVKAANKSGGQFTISVSVVDDKSETARSAPQVTLGASSRIANTGAVVGRLQIIESTDQHRDATPGAILVTHHTNNEWNAVFAKLAAVVTTDGGVTSHAAQNAQAIGIPCIVGAAEAIDVLKKWNGQVVTLDADHRRIYLGEMPILIEERDLNIWNVDPDIFSVIKGRQEIHEIFRSWADSKLKRPEVFGDDFEGEWRRRSDGFGWFQLDYYYKAWDKLTDFFNGTYGERSPFRLVSQRREIKAEPKGLSLFHQVVPNDPADIYHFFSGLEGLSLEDYLDLYEARWRGFQQFAMFTESIETLDSSNVDAMVDALIDAFVWMHIGFWLDVIVDENLVRPRLVYLHKELHPYLRDVAVSDILPSGSINPFRSDIKPGWVLELSRAKDKEIYALLERIRRTPSAVAAFELNNDNRVDAAAAIAQRLEMGAPEILNAVRGWSDKYKETREHIELLDDTPRYLMDLHGRLKSGATIGIPLLARLFSGWEDYDAEKIRGQDPVLYDLIASRARLLAFESKYPDFETGNTEAMGNIKVLAMNSISPAEIEARIPDVLEQLLAQSEETGRYEQNARHIFEKLPELKVILALSRMEIVLREDGHHLIVPFQRKIARMMLNQGRLAVAKGILEKPEDIFKIGTDELIAVVREDRPLYIRDTLARWENLAAADIRMQERWSSDPRAAAGEFDAAVRAAISVLRRQASQTSIDRVRDAYLSEADRLRNRSDRLMERAAESGSPYDLVHVRRAGRAFGFVAGSAGLLFTLESALLLAGQVSGLSVPDFLRPSFVIFSFTTASLFALQSIAFGRERRWVEKAKISFSVSSEPVTSAEKLFAIERLRHILAGYHLLEGGLWDSVEVRVNSYLGHRGKAEARVINENGRQTLEISEWLVRLISSDPESPDLASLRTQVLETIFDRHEFIRLKMNRSLSFAQFLTDRGFQTLYIYAIHRPVTNLIRWVRSLISVIPERWSASPEEIVARLLVSGDEPHIGAILGPVEKSGVEDLGGVLHHAALPGVSKVLDQDVLVREIAKQIRIKRGMGQSKYSAKTPAIDQVLRDAVDAILNGVEFSDIGGRLSTVLSESKRPFIGVVIPPSADAEEFAMNVLSRLERPEELSRDAPAVGFFAPGLSQDQKDRIAQYARELGIVRVLFMGSENLFDPLHEVSGWNVNWNALDALTEGVRREGFGTHVFIVHRGLMGNLSGYSVLPQISLLKQGMILVINDLFQAMPLIDGNDIDNIWRDAELIAKQA